MRWAVLALLGCALAPAQQKGASPFTPVNEAAYSKLTSVHKGKILLVDFWATWCIPCRKETPEIVRMADRLAARGLDVVAISWDEPEQESAALRFLKDNKVSGTPYIKRAPDDDKFSMAVDPTWSGALPALFLYDRTGKKVKTFIGETPTKDVEVAILKLL